MAQELIIHIGLPKTGSTALQAFFSRNREELLKHSIDYLPMGEFRQGQAGGIASGNGAYVARSMLPVQDPAYLSWDEDRISGTFRNLARNSAAKSLLISSELFALPRPSEWSKVLDLCRALNLTLSIIAVVRNQIDWLSSSYLQDIKRRQLIHDPVDFIRPLYRGTRYLKYDSYFSELAKVVSGNIRLVSYDKHAYDGSLVGETLRSLGVNNYAGPVHQDFINVTPGPAEIAFLRTCNLYRPSMYFSDILATTIAADATGKRGAAARWTVIDKVLAAEIETFFVEENKRLRLKFELGHDFFSRPCENFININTVSVDTEKMVSLFAQYLVAYDLKIRSLSDRIEALDRDLRKR